MYLAANYPENIGACLVLYMSTGKWDKMGNFTHLQFSQYSLTRYT